MATVTCFEDLIVWQKARQLTKEIYYVTSKGTFARDFALRDQIRDAAVSTMTNIAEGFERRSPGEFSHFLNIAKSSCAEVRSELYVALDAAHLAQEVFARLKAMAEEVGRMLAGLKSRVDARKATKARNSELGTRNWNNDDD